MDQSDLTGAAEGDQSCWRRLVDGYSPRLYGFVFRRCGNRDVAEEVVQEAFMKVIGRLGQFSDVGSFEAWIFRVARNAMFDRVRKQQRWGKVIAGGGGAPEDAVPVVQQVASNDPLPSEVVEKDELLGQLRAWVGELGEKEQEVLEMRHTGQLKYEQIAEALGEPVGTVLARAHRAVKKLRQKMLDAGLLQEGLAKGSGT